MATPVYDQQERLAALSRSTYRVTSNYQISLRRREVSVAEIIVLAWNIPMYSATTSNYHTINIDNIPNELPFNYYIFQISDVSEQSSTATN